MIVPASAVRFVCSGALINVQSLESVAFSFSWHPGATGWQVHHGKLLDLVIIPKPKRGVLRIEGGISKGIKGGRQTLLLDYAPGKKSDTSHYDNRVS
jgi:hypothetical protein